MHRSEKSVSKNIDQIAKKNKLIAAVNAAMFKLTQKKRHEKNGEL